MFSLKCFVIPKTPAHLPNAVSSMGHVVFPGGMGADMLLSGGTDSQCVAPSYAAGTACPVPPSVVSCRSRHGCVAGGCVTAEPSQVGGWGERHSCVLGGRLGSFYVHYSEPLWFGHLLFMSPRCVIHDACFQMSMPPMATLGAGCKMM